MLFCILAEAFPCLSSSGEPSPPAVHGQRGMGKAYRLGLVKQDDGGMPIVEYIVKYKTVSISEVTIAVKLFSFSFISPIQQAYLAVRLQTSDEEFCDQGAFFSL